MRRMKDTMQSQYKQMKNKSKEKMESILKRIEEEFYHTLREEQIKVIDAGSNNLRFLKVYDHILKPIVIELEEYKKQIQEATDINLTEKFEIANRV